MASPTDDPLESAVIGVGSMLAGVPETGNVIPAEMRLRGTACASRPHVRDPLEAAIGRVAGGAARTHGCRADYRYIRRNLRFDFNDSALPVGAAFRASLVETELPVT